MRSKQANILVIYFSTRKIFTASFVTNIFRNDTERKAMETRGNWPKAPVSLYIHTAR